MERVSSLNGLASLRCTPDAVAPASMNNGWQITDGLADWLRAAAPTRQHFRHIVELGPGRSTAVLAEAWPQATITTIEAEWRFIPQIAHQICHLPNVRLILAPLVADPATLRIWHHLQHLDLREIDLLLIDGPAGWHQPGIRRGAAALLPHVRLGGLVVLDDAHRPAEAALCEAWTTQEARLLVDEDHERFVTWVRVEPG